jgi:multidrug efflux pump subunit AcrB
LVLQAPNFKKLQEALPKFMEQVRESKVLVTPDVNLKFNKPELNILVDREKANSLSVSELDIAQTLQLSLSNQRFGYFTMNGKQYQIIGQFSRENRDETLDLKSIYVRSKKGNLVQLDNVVKVEELSSPPQLYHFNRYQSATVSAGLAPGKTIADGVKEMRAIAKKVLDESFTTSLSGPSKKAHQMFYSHFF